MIVTKLTKMYIKLKFPMFDDGDIIHERGVEVGLRANVRLKESDS